MVLQVSLAIKFYDFVHTTMVIDDSIGKNKFADLDWVAAKVIYAYLRTFASEEEENRLL